MWVCFDFGDVLTKDSRARERGMQMLENKTSHSSVEESIKQASRHLRNQKRVDLYLSAVINGMLSDGELTMARIDVKLLLDKAEEIARGAISRADKITAEVLKTDPIRT